MNLRNKLKIAELLTMQSSQLNDLLLNLDGKILDLVSDATTDQKLLFYRKVNRMYADKRDKLRTTGALDEFGRHPEDRLNQRRDRADSTG